MNDTPPRRRPGQRRGYSLVELLITLTVLMVALAGYLRAMSEAMELSRVNREHALAREAARLLIETLQEQPLARVYAEYNARSDDDPNGAGTGLGPSFDVPGLEPPKDDAVGRVGRIQFPENAAGALSETPATRFPFLPRDLNLDGDALDDDVAADHVLLPVRVLMRWGGSSTPRQLEFTTFLVDRRSS